MMTFKEFVAVQEGLWLNDKLAVVGLSKTSPPTPSKKGKWPTPPKLKSTSKPCEAMDQLHRNVADLGKLGISLFPPKREDLERLLDKYKSQVTIPRSAWPSVDRKTAVSLDTDQQRCYPGGDPPQQARDRPNPSKAASRPQRRLGSWNTSASSGS